LNDQFDDLAYEASKNLRAATDGHRQPVQGNGSGQPNRTDNYGGTKQESGERHDASAK
jgi:hypothetical protein